MPHLTLIYPAIGRQTAGRYVRSWQMEPLAMAVLAGLTPPDWRIGFHDDRVEEVAFDRPTDLVGISIETFTARRGYEIADRFRARGIPVVLGGYHATFRPEEAARHADAVCVGEAEPVWARILADARRGALHGVYRSTHAPDLAGIRPRRDIFRDKPYLRLALIETGRGCPHRCDFCSISAFFGATHRRRPVADVVAEIRSAGAKTVFFVDDNLVGEPAGARALFDAIAPLDIRWVSQAPITAAYDADLVDRMARSGCMGLLIGFESLDPRNLAAMGKGLNDPGRYAAGLARLRRAGISVYGTFVFGFPHDTRDSFREAVRFAMRERFYLAAFNHAVPFPGTPFYADLEREGRLPHPAWWLDESYRFGDVPFRPAGLSADEVAGGCHQARRLFFKAGSILGRTFEFRANARTPRKAVTCLALNWLLRREVNQKRGIPLGDRRVAPGAAP
jgi:radical SAM superfamily enzyme YgiQ (UPF0313 family)